jgi:5-carboxymethyl-2-hydroxymuconate isomerase
MSEIRVRNSEEVIKVQNVYCVGKNYLEHLKEIEIPGINQEIPKEPVIFLKPNNAVLTDSNIISIPLFKGKKISDNLQNEVELVVVIGKDGRNILQENAFDHIFGYAVGIDFTLRDLQTEQKKKGLPWAVSKGFYSSAPVFEVVKKEEIPEPENLRICLDVNGEVKQSANTSEMLFKLDYIVHYISCIFGLCKGDLIFTGTPAGITKLYSGDKVSAYIENIGELKVTIE